MAEEVKVEVKSPWVSKINWTQMLAMAASLATVFGWTVPPDLVPAAVTAITAVQAVATVVMRTWFTKTVTPEAAAK